ncbi:MAG TPA: hypothetical protein VFZ16_09525 [Hyphomicrobiaceae bacterium]|nr:hypothetical protein [Hyphomicrobiaceae bacterium]
MGQDVNPIKHDGHRSRLTRDCRQRVAYALVHAVTGGVFMYLLQTSAFDATLKTSLPIAVTSGVAAAGVAW